MLATPIGDKYIGDLEVVGLIFCSGILQTSDKCLLTSNLGPEG